MLQISFSNASMAILNRLPQINFVIILIFYCIIYFTKYETKAAKNTHVSTVKERKPTNYQFLKKIRRPFKTVRIDRVNLVDERR